MNGKPQRHVHEYDKFWKCTGCDYVLPLNLRKDKSLGLTEQS